MQESYSSTQLMCQVLHNVSQGLRSVRSAFSLKLHGPVIKRRVGEVDYKVHETLRGPRDTYCLHFLEATGLKERFRGCPAAADY